MIPAGSAALISTTNVCGWAPGRLRSRGDSAGHGSGHRIPENGAEALIDRKIRAFRDSWALSLPAGFSARLFGVSVDSLARHLARFSVAVWKGGVPHHIV